MSDVSCDSMRCPGRCQCREAACSCHERHSRGNDRRRRVSGRRDCRVGIVGVRGRGLSLARYWRLVPGARVVAVADLVPERLEEARRELGDIALYASHLDMLEREDLEVVTVG